MSFLKNLTVSSFLILSVFVGTFFIANTQTSFADQVSASTTVYVDSSPPTPTVNGGWTSWGACDASSNQTRNCTNPNQSGSGTFCTKNDGGLTTSTNTSETKKCGITGTLTVTNCTIPLDGTSCNIGVSWSTSGTGTFTVQDTTNNTQKGSGASGSFSHSVTPDTINYSLKDGGTFLDTKQGTASCVTNTTWNGSKCAAGGTGTDSPQPCPSDTYYDGGSNTCRPNQTNVNTTGCTSGSSNGFGWCASSLGGVTATNCTIPDGGF